MQTIYIDVLIVLNVYVNYFLLRITAGISHLPLKAARCAAASFYGSLFSLLILFPTIPAVILTAIKSLAAVSIVFFAFGSGGIKRLMKSTAIFFAVNFSLAGAVYAVYSWLKPTSLHFNNTYFYIDFSIAVLLITTAVLYIAVKIAMMISGAGAGEGNYSVTVKYRGKTLLMGGLADTGNALIDYFSGLAVIICDERRAAEIVGVGDILENLPKGFRLIPCSTVSDSGLIPIFRPDEVMIRNIDNGEEKKVDAMIGFGRSGGEAVFNPKLLKL